MENSDIAIKATAFSDENRVKILKMLATKELCGCNILEYLGVSQPTLSYHMRLLTESGLVCARRSGKWTYYSLNMPEFSALKEALDEVVQTKIKDLPNLSCEELPSN